MQNQLPEGKASALEEVTRFNEREVLEDHSSYIVRALEVLMFYMLPWKYL